MLLVPTPHREPLSYPQIPRTIREFHASANIYASVRVGVGQNPTTLQDNPRSVPNSSPGAHSAMPDDQNGNRLMELAREEREARSNLAGLRSKARKAHRGISLALEALMDEDKANRADFEEIRWEFERVENIDVARLIEDSEYQVSRIRAVRREIREIENQESPSTRTRAA